MDVEFRNVLNMERHWPFFMTRTENPGSENEAQDYNEPPATWSIQCFWCHTNPSKIRWPALQVQCFTRCLDLSQWTKAPDSAEKHFSPTETNNCNFSIILLPSVYYITLHLHIAVSIHRWLKDLQPQHQPHIVITSFHIQIYCWASNLLLSYYKNVFGIILSKFYSVLYML